MSKVITLTDNNFDDYFAKSKLLVIDFWAPWCEPCKGFNKILHEIAEEKTQAEICFGTVNVDEEKKLALDFSVKSVPTLAIIHNQLMVFCQSGAMPKKALIDLLQQAMNLPEEIPFTENH